MWDYYIWSCTLHIRQKIELDVYIYRDVPQLVKIEWQIRNNEINCMILLSQATAWRGLSPLTWCTDMTERGVCSRNKLSTFHSFFPLSILNLNEFRKWSWKSIHLMAQTMGRKGKYISCLKWRTTQTVTLAILHRHRLQQENPPSTTTSMMSLKASLLVRLITPVTPLSNRRIYPLLTTTMMPRHLQSFRWRSNPCRKWAATPAWRWRYPRLQFAFPPLLLVISLKTKYQVMGK